MIHREQTLLFQYITLAMTIAIVGLFSNTPTLHAELPPPPMWPSDESPPPPVSPLENSMDPSLQNTNDKSKVEASSKDSDGVRELSFFTPEVDTVNSTKKGRVFMLAGKAEPGVPIKGSSDIITLIGKDKTLTEIPWTSVLLKPFPVRPNRDGYFEIRLKLPIGKVQLSFAYANQEIVAILDTRETEISLINNAKKASKNPYTDRNYTLWGGMGLSYVNYGQTFNSSLSDFDYNSISLPSLYFKGVRRFKQRWYLNLLLKAASDVAANFGTVKDAPSNPFQWRSIILEGVKFPSRWKQLWNNHTYQFGFNFGLQEHAIPFLKQTSGSVFIIESNSITMLSAGGNIEINRKRNLYYEIFLRYQIPIRTSGFDITPKVTFDGSTGAIYRYNGRLKFGIFWYGQLQQYEFKTTSNQSGEQFLFYSNIDLRLAYGF